MIPNDKDTKPYILKYLCNIELPRSQYITTSIINYGHYIDNMFTLENFTHTFQWQLINTVNSQNPDKINKDILMLRYNQLLVDRYSDTAFLIKHITK